MWTGENLVSSFGRPRIVSLPGLPAAARELHGEWARIVGQTKLDGNFLRPPFGDPTSLITNDGFDQVQTYWALTGLALYLQNLGFNMTAILGGRKPIVANVNSVKDLNAWFDPSTGELTFGTASDKWHLASDHDITQHEGGHLIFDCIIPSLTSWHAGDGGAIHEGFGDCTAALFRNDPHLSEDFPPAMGWEYGTDKGLRDVTNALRYGDTTDEVHDRGQVYGAYWWSVRLALQNFLGGDPRTAASLVHAIMMEHGSHYSTNKPGPKDFLNAAIAGALTYLGANTQYRLDPENVRKIMTDEAGRRGMLDAAIPQFGTTQPLSIDLARTLLAMTSPVAFMPVTVTRGTFGGRNFLQQIILANGKYVTLLGSGLIVFTNRDGEPHSFSASDVRRDIRFDPTINFSPQVAFGYANQAAQEELRASEREIEELSGPAAAAPADEHGRNTEIDNAQMRRRLAEIAVQAAARTTDPVRIATLVLMPEGYTDHPQEDLYWRFRFGPSEFFVNARSGQVAIKRMPMW